MSVFRVNKTNDYTVMSNSHLKEKDMSLKAKGLLSEMLSLPDNWDYSIEGLVAINKEKEACIKATLEELKRFKYLSVTKRLPNETDSGRIEYIYDVYENPKQGIEKQPLEKQPLEKQPLEIQPLEIQPLEIQPLENQGQLNIYNKYTNNKNTNNKKYNVEDIIEYLNQKADKNYKSTTKSTISKIKARYDEGFTLEDFKTVIDKKCTEWKNTEMEKYLRPDTLFGTKFEGYLNQKEITKEKSFKERLEEWGKKE